MKDIDGRVSALMRRQQSLITLPQALGAGYSPKQVQNRVRSGLWIRLHPGVYASASAAPTPMQALLAAHLAAGRRAAAASHLSAAWMLGLVRDPPAQPTLTVPYERCVVLAGVTVHRSRDLALFRLLERNGILYTDPLRVLTDLAGEMSPHDLSPIVDRALAGGLVTTEGLLAEVARRSRSGRRGPRRLVKLLEHRGFIGGPEPSVLEAEALRLFRRWSIPVLGREVRVGSDGRYRIDFQISPLLVVEVDGFAHHWSPEHKAYDDARRNRLRAAGLTVLVYDWRAVRFEERRLAMEVSAALASLSAAG